MHICVIPPSYPNKYNPQSSIFVYELCKALSMRDNRVTVLDSGLYTIKHWTDKSCWILQKEKDEYQTIYRFHTPLVFRSFFKRTGILLAFLRISKMFRRLIKEDKLPDVIYAHFSYPSGVAAARISKKYKIPLAFEEHAGRFLEPNVSQFYCNVLRYVTNSSKCIIAVSSSLAEKIEKMTLKKTLIVPNLIDDRFQYYKSVSKKKFVFFSAGNLVKIKNMDLLIKAFAEAFNDINDVELRIAGDGPERTNLLKIIEDQQLQNKVTLLGRLDREEILSQYIYSDAFALLSGHETFGVAFRESLAVGRPVVTSENQGMLEDWQEEFGIMVPIGNISQSAKALKEMYINLEKYNGKLISSIVCQRYAASSVSEKVERILSQVSKMEV